MTSLGNDRWQASMMPSRVGRHVYTIEAWWDVLATFAHELEIKHRAGADVKLELVEGRQLLAQAHARADGNSKDILEKASNCLETADADSSVRIFLDPPLRAAMWESGERIFRAQHSPLTLEVERPQAAFASW